MKRLFGILILALAFVLCFGVTAFADEAVSENYEVSDTAYTVYTEAQLVEVFDGVVDGTLESKTIVLGCDITMSDNDLYLDVACDVSVDLNGKTLTNKRRVNQTGDFQFKTKDAILRIKNGNIVSNFCVFIFYDAGQVYAENINVTSAEECVYGYDGCYGVLDFKNCNMKTTSNSYPAISLNGGCGKDTGAETGGTTYRIEGGEYRGMNIYCPNAGSYVKDCKVYGFTLKLDTWCKHGVNGEAYEMPFYNVDASEVKVYVGDARMSAAMYDCEFVGVSLANSNITFTAYTSPTCTEAGTKCVYTGSTTPSGAYDSEYPSLKPALGHSKTDSSVPVGISYPNGFATVGNSDYNCAACTERFSIEGDAEAIFIPSGYTVKNGGTGIGMGFTVNQKALSEYESMNETKIIFNIAVFNPKYLKDGSVIVNGAVNSDSGVISVGVDTEYSNVNFLISGFTSAHADLELAFIGYAYEQGSEDDICIMQKEYVSTEDNQIESPMYRKLGDIYTVKLETVANPSYVGNKSDLEDYNA